MTHPSPEAIQAEHTLRTARARERYAIGGKNGTRSSVTVKCGQPDCGTWIRAEDVDDGNLAEVLLDSECPACGGEMALERRSVR